MIGGVVLIWAVLQFITAYALRDTTQSWMQANCPFRTETMPGPSLADDWPTSEKMAMWKKRCH